VRKRAGARGTFIEENEMPRTYSFDHFQAKKPMQAAVGSQDRLGNDEDAQKPLKSELQETQPDSVPGANQGAIHYGMAHSETVKRLQARRAARAKKEARAAAATKRPSGTRKAATSEAAAKPEAKKASAKSEATPVKKAKPSKSEAAPAKKAKPSTSEAAPAKKAKPSAEEHSTPKTARKSTVAREEPAAETPAKRATAKQGLLGRVVGTVARTALTTGSKGLARAAALAKEVRASKSKPAAKPEKPGGKAEKSKKR
jgi:hypothetical protein